MTVWISRRQMLVSLVAIVEVTAEIKLVGDRLVFGQVTLQPLTPQDLPTEIVETLQSTWLSYLRRLTMSNKTPAAVVVCASVAAAGPCLTAQHTMLSPCGIAA